MPVPSHNVRIYPKSWQGLSVIRVTDGQSAGENWSLQTLIDNLERDGGDKAVYQSSRISIKQEGGKQYGHPPAAKLASSSLVACSYSTLNTRGVVCCLPECHFGDRPPCFWLAPATLTGEAQWLEHGIMWTMESLVGCQEMAMYQGMHRRQSRPIPCHFWRQAGAYTLMRT